MRAALYARVSTRDHDQDPETQLLALRRFAEAEGYTVREFVDHGVSGKDLRRPAWQKMMQQVRRGSIKAVMVWHLDRAFRSVLDCETVLSELDMLNVRFVPLQQRDLDTRTPMGRAMIQMAAVFAELMRADLPAKIKAGHDRARANGKKIGRPRSSLTAEACREAVEAASGNISHAAIALGAPLSTVRLRLQE
jgi:DNA invertase Pin-like site-specific DNA recombinase